MIDTSSGNVLAQGSTMVNKGGSMWTLFWEADLFVQLIMIALLLASFWSWAIIFSKLQEFRKVFQLSNHFEKLFWSGKSFDKIEDDLKGKPLDPMGKIFLAALEESNYSKVSTGTQNVELKMSILQRIQRVMEATSRQEISRLEKATGFLASVGSSAPFIGLLGTVWGIMHSFQSIASSKNTSLAVVAPGIAEALAATALGLLAAIPAVIAYNKISSSLYSYSNRLENFSNDLYILISRQLLGEK